MLFTASSSLLMQAGRSTWPTVDRNILSWIEIIFIVLGVAMELTALGILAQRQDRLRSRRDAAPEAGVMWQDWVIWISIVSALGGLVFISLAFHSEARYSRHVA